MADDATEPDRAPRWVQALDAASLLLIVIAAAVAIGGGFRVSAGLVRVSVLSPWLPLLLGAAAAAVRHVLMPRPTLTARISGWMTRLTSLESWRAAWAPFLISRAGVLVVGLLALLTIGIRPDAPPLRVADSDLVNLPLRWDAGWYMSVARIGYMWTPRDVGRQQNVAFFPAFPMAMRTHGPVVRRQRCRVPVWRPGGLARGVSLGVDAALPARARRSWRRGGGGRGGHPAGELPLLRVPRRCLHRVGVPSRGGWRRAGLQAGALGSRLPLGRACRADTAQRRPVVADGRGARVRPASEATAVAKRGECQSADSPQSSPRSRAPRSTGCFSGSSPATRSSGPSSTRPGAGPSGSSPCSTCTCTT